MKFSLNRFKNQKAGAAECHVGSGGMGDLLTGVIAALRAQGLPPYPAAALGAMIHARAADGAARRDGERGLLATDLLTDLRRELNGHDH